MSGPRPPDPKEQAAAQTGTNIGTAVANVTMQPNISNPFGTSNTTQTGTSQWTDSYTGQTYDLPEYTTSQSFNPQFQGYFDNAAAASDTSIDDRLFELGRQRIDPRMADQRASIQTRLANQGIAPGSEAYNREFELFNQQENDAYNSLALSGRGQAMAEQNNALNMALGLASGVPINTPNVGIPTTDVAGLENANYEARANNHQNMMRGLLGIATGDLTGSLLGGLFGIGG